MADIDVNKIQEIKEYLVRSVSHFGGAKFTSIMKTLTENEKDVLFSDNEILKKLYKLEDYDSLASVFRAVPASIQELLFSNIHSQKVLLGIGTCEDEDLIKIIKNKKFFNFQDLDKRNKSGKFYYTPAKLRALSVLFRHIKSSDIFENLVTNKYFQMIMLFCKKVSDEFYKYINVEAFFHAIINSEIYDIADTKSKSNWVQHINNNYSMLLLPHDIKNLYLPTTSFSTYYYRDEKKTLGSMLNSKIHSLASKEMSFDIDCEDLKKLNMQEINVLKSDANGVVVQDSINELLSQIVDESLSDGSVFEKEYLDINNLGVSVQRSMFKMVVDRAIGNPQYEKQILDYLFNNLFREQYNELEKEALMISLKNSLVNANEDTIANLFTYANDLKSVFFLRFNLTAQRMDYLHGISVAQLMRINVKHINRLVKLIFDPEIDELSDSYAKAIKMYLVFGLERSIELLSGAYPINKDFFDNVSKLKVNKVDMKIEGKKYLPVINEEFNRFMFAAHNIDALFDDDTAISSCWFYLYNNFEEIKKTCKGHVTLVQAETILKEQVNTVKFELDPDCYRLEKILHEAGLGNKTKHSNDEVYYEMVSAHKKQIRRITSSIPYVKGILETGWSYEVMRMDSAIAYVLGFRANCCIRILDIAHNHLLHALLCENGRILLTYKPDGSIASFSPLKRNGELLIANSIEAIDKEDNSIARIVETFKEGMKDICKTSKENESTGYLKVATIGNASVRKPAGELWPYEIPTPTILEKDDPVYKDTDSYHGSLLVFYKDEKANLRNMKYGKVERQYFDPRKPILSCLCSRDTVLMQRKITKVIDSVRYINWIDSGKSEEYFEKTRLGYFTALFCNDDWFLIVTLSGEVRYDYLKDDPRAKKELDATLAVINEYGKNNERIRDYVISLNNKKTK